MGELKTLDDIKSSNVSKSSCFCVFHRALNQRDIDINPSMRCNSCSSACNCNVPGTSRRQFCSQILWARHAMSSTKSVSTRLSFGGAPFVVLFFSWWGEATSWF